MNHEICVTPTPVAMGLAYHTPSTWIIRHGPKPTYEELVNRVQELETLVAEHEKTKVLLHNSQEQFQLLYERAPLSYQSLDENGNFIQVNQANTDKRPKLYLQGNCIPHS